MKYVFSGEVALQVDVSQSIALERLVHPCCEVVSLRNLAFK